MSDNTIHNKNNNKVYQNTNINMAERQSSTNTTLNNNISTTQPTTTQTPQHQHFINIPIPPNSTPNINILQQLNLPPLPPPAAFQPIIQPTAPGAPIIPTTPIAPAIVPKLNPSAPTFTPNPFMNIPLTQTNSSTPSVSVQGYPQQPNQQQINFINQKIQESLAKLQLLSIQLNTLNLINQQQQTIQSLQQYQNVYQQYQLEIGNSLLLNQYLANLKQNISNTPTPGQTTPGLNDDNAAKKPTIGQLETIEEGEEEEMMEDGDEIAAAATPTTNDGDDADEGTKGLEAADKDKEDVEEQKYDTLETETEAIGESINDAHAQPVVLQIGEGNEKVSELEKIKRQIRGILNKITPENFDKLSQEIASILKIADIAVQNKQLQSLTDEQLRVAQKAQFKALIRLILKCILEKAVNEPLFSNQYARLCYSLYLYAEQNELKKKLFRQQLLSLAHSVFKKARNAGNSARFIGIITMIGELFIYSLISWNVISSGIFEELLPPESALDIEAVCKLLKISGHHFDKHHYKDINSVIDRIAKYAQGYDFRTQCLVQDIYEMRQNDWKQREVHQKEQPKTLNQVHKDFHAEKKIKNKKVTNNQHQHQPPQQQKTPYRPARYNNNNNDYQHQPSSTQTYKPRYNASSRNYNAPRGGNRWRNNNQGHGHYHNNNKYHGYHHNNQYHHGHSTHYNQRRKSKSLRPTVEFVKDVTLPDRSHYPANQLLVKKWAMRNSGELSWGDNVELVYFKGDEQLSLKKRYKVINAQPGSEVEISATIKTPNEPGRYCTYFRLQKNGKFFGPRVWVDIIVSPQSTNARLTTQEVHNKQMVSCCQ